MKLIFLKATPAQFVMEDAHVRFQLYIAAHKKRNEAVTLKIMDGFPTKSLYGKYWNLSNQHEVSGTSTSIGDAAVECLEEGNPQLKAQLTLYYGALWDQKSLSQAASKLKVPDTPARDIQTVCPRDAPRRGKGGSMQNRIKLIHSLAHIESTAIDLSWDIVARFAFDKCLPREFIDDWVEVACDEARHYLMWQTRLEEMDSFYGALPCHSGLWDTAFETRTCPLERLGIEHMLLEGRGLDVAQGTHAKFLQAGDSTSAGLLEAIYCEEVSHVAKGVKWFEWIHSRNDPNMLVDPVDTFHDIVERKFRGKLKGPFNYEARSRASMRKEYFEY